MLTLIAVPKVAAAFQLTDWSCIQMKVLLNASAVEA